MNSLQQPEQKDSRESIRENKSTGKKYKSSRKKTGSRFETVRQSNEWRKNSSFSKIEKQILDLRVENPEVDDMLREFSFWKLLYKHDKGIQKLSFNKDDCFADVQSKIKAYLQTLKIEYRYDHRRDVLYKVKQLPMLSGYLFYIELMPFFNLRWKCPDAYGYFLWLFHNSSFMYNSYSFGWGYMEEIDDEMYEDVGPSNFRMNIMVRTICKDINRKTYSDYNVSNIPETLKSLMENLLVHFDEMAVFVPLIEKIEGTDEDIVLESFYSLRQCVGSVDLFESDYAEMSQQYANEVYGNCDAVHCPVVYVEYDGDKSYNNLADIQRFKDYYFNWYKWTKKLKMFVKQMNKVEKWKESPIKPIKKI